MIYDERFSEEMGQYEGCGDEELILRLRDGEAGISDYLMEKYKGLVRRKARALYLIGGDTDDLIQEGMIGLFKAVRDYQPGRGASFVTFARMCIDRQIYTAIQISNRQKHQPLNSYVSLNGGLGEGADAQSWLENPESIVIAQENAMSLEEEIRKSLSSMENQVLEHYLAGYSYADIGEALGKSTKSIDNALRRIRGKIRDCLEKKYN